MHYNVILFFSKCVVLTAAGLTVTDHGKGLNEEINFVGSHSSHELVIDRRRRSIWQTVVNHLADAVETFHAKPLLAGAKNVGGFKNEIRDVSRWANVVLSKGPEEKDTLGSKENPTVKGDQKVADENQFISSKDDIEIFDLMQEGIYEREEELLNHILYKKKYDKDWLGTESDGPLSLFIMYPEYVDLKTIKKEFFDSNPKLMGDVVSELEKIKKMREEVLELGRNLSKNVLPFLPKNETDLLHDKLDYVIKLNIEWIKQQHALKWLEEF